MSANRHPLSRDLSEMDNFCHWLIREPQGDGPSNAFDWGGDTTLSSNLRRTLPNSSSADDFLDEALAELLRSMNLHPEVLFPLPLPNQPIDAAHQPDYAAMLGYLRASVRSAAYREHLITHPQIGDPQSNRTSFAEERLGLDELSRESGRRSPVRSLDWAPEAGIPEPIAPDPVFDGEREREVDLLIEITQARARALERLADRLGKAPACADRADQAAAVSRVAAYARQDREVVEREYRDGQRTELAHGTLADINEIWAQSHGDAAARNRGRDFEPLFVRAVWRAVEELALARTSAMVNKSLEGEGPSAILAAAASRVRAPLEYLKDYHARTMETRLSRGQVALAVIVPSPAHPDPLLHIAEARKLIWHALLLESGYPRNAHPIIAPFPVWPGGSEASRRLTEGGVAP